MLKWLILITGLIFILYSIFFSSSNKSKFSSDLPKDGKPFYKTKKGIFALCLILLLLVFSVYLLLSLLM